MGFSQSSSIIQAVWPMDKVRKIPCLDVASRTVQKQIDPSR
jgi:hypothetical protein